MEDVPPPNSSSDDVTVEIDTVDDDDDDNKYVLTTHSKSLFNFSQSPGWTAEENRVLKEAIMFYGIGGWTKFMQLGLLPGGKMPTQITIQVQRILGQQSLGGFMQLRVDPDEVRRENESLLQRHQEQVERLSRGEQLRDGEKPLNVKVKNGLVVNAGKNPTRQSRMRQLESNRRRFAMDQEEVERRVNEFDLFSIKRLRRLQFTEFLREYLRMCREKKEQEKEEGEEEGKRERGEEEEKEDPLEEQLRVLQTDLAERRKRLQHLLGKLQSRQQNENSDSYTADVVTDHHAPSMTEESEECDHGPETPPAKRQRRMSS